VVPGEAYREKKVISKIRENKCETNRI